MELIIKRIFEKEPYDKAFEEATEQIRTFLLPMLYGCEYCYNENIIINAAPGTSLENEVRVVLFTPPAQVQKVAGELGVAPEIYMGVSGQRVCPAVTTGPLAAG